MLTYSLLLWAKNREENASCNIGTFVAGYLSQNIEWFVKTTLHDVYIPHQSVLVVQLQKYIRLAYAKGY